MLMSFTNKVKINFNERGVDAIALKYCVDSRTLLLLAFTGSASDGFYYPWLRNGLGSMNYRRVAGPLETLLAANVIVELPFIFLKKLYDARTLNFGMG
jgi:hypothetical protein